MKKTMIVAIALALGVLSVGAANAANAASAAQCCGDGSCQEQQAMQQFSKDTAGLTSAAKAKEIELRELYAGSTVDPHAVDRLETELKDLKQQIRSAAEHHNLPACCAS